jgi:cytochrome b
MREEHGGEVREKAVARRDGRGRMVVVWDLPTRLFHWLTVVLVAAAYVTWRLNWMDWHVWAGEALLALVLFRVAWGFLGSESARFAGFLASPAAAARHLAHALRREPDRQAGHNPAGGWMVVLLIILLLGETVSGIYVNNDVADDGPFTALVPAAVANFITGLHTVLWDALAACVALHVLAIAIYAAAKRQNLTRAMITGRKLLPPSVKPPRLAHWAGALVLLGASVAVAALVADFL